MFRIMRNNHISETDLLETAAQAIRKRLPFGWSLCDYGRELLLQGGKSVDAALQIRDPQGCSAVIIVEIKRGPIEARQVILQIRDYWERWLSSAQGDDTLALNSESSIGVMAVAPYIGPSARERLSEAGISFADLTGNIRFAVDRPAVFIETQGAGKNPYRENVPLRSLKGRGAVRAVRGLLDYCPPFGTRELANVTKSSASTISRVADLLEREAILCRETPRGPIISVDWERLLRRWAADYDYLNANEMTPWLEPRGIRTLMDKLRGADFEYAVTGSFAATRLAPVTEPRLAAIYAANPAYAAKYLRLRPAETGGNVLIGRPFSSVAFDRIQLADGITYARVTQVVADLMTGPGRGPAEAESLIEWMRCNEDVWRLPLMNTT